MGKEVLSAQVNETLLEDQKTYNRNKWLFCSSGIGRDALYTLVSTYFLTYVQFGIGLTVGQYALMTTLIGVVGRIWDGINDPMMGAIVEGSHMKWGKFKPWIFIGAILDSLLTIALFNVGRNLTGTQTGYVYVVIICLIYLLWEAAFTMNDIGYWSMIPSLSRTKERRDEISTLTVFFAGIGTIAMTGFITLLQSGNLLECYTIASIVAAVMVIAMQSYTAFGVVEGPREDEKAVEEGQKTDISLGKMVKTIFANKQLLWISIAHLCNSVVTGLLIGLIYNFYWLEGSYDGGAFYFVVAYAIANTLVQLIYPSLAKKYGRKKIQLVSYHIMAAGFIGMALIGWWYWLPFSLLTLIPFGLLVFVGNTLFYTADIINFNNCVEYNEYQTGERSEAVVTTMRPLIVKFADAVKYLVTTIVLITSGLYTISRNIPAMETQISYASRFENTAEMKEYINEVNEFYTIWNVLPEKEKEDEEALEKFFEEKNASGDYATLAKCQYNALFAEVYREMLVVETTESGNVTIERIKNIDINSLSDDKTYVLALSDETQNIADENFKEVARNEKPQARIVLRIAFCGIPFILQTLALEIQRKKFIIDEEYFDKITKEIEERKAKEAK